VAYESDFFGLIMMMMRIYCCTPGDTANELLEWFLVESVILQWMVVQQKKRVTELH
jgi:hypothetical protein